MILRPQPDAPLFSPGLVRNDHGETAHAAARQVRGKRELYHRLLTAIDGSIGGLTDEELQLTTGMNPSTERPRRVELVDAGVLCDSGNRRKTRSGRAAVVWSRVKDTAPKSQEAA